MPIFKSPKGTRDIFYSELYHWQVIESRAREIFRRYNYKEISTPIFEDKKLFLRGLGTQTEIVEKQLFILKYSSQEEEKEKFCLRPEGTAPVVRAYVEHNLYKDWPVAKFFYIGPMFRGERPQKGRLRQFHHIGAELIGSLSFYADLEIIMLSSQIIKELGINNYKMLINSLGCNQDKERLKMLLKEKLSGVKEKLCEVCQRRLHTNILRILDCKNETCRKLVRELRIDKEDYLCEECLIHYLNLRQQLEKFKVSFKEDPYLVRGLDYYTQTVFEFVHPSLGAQNAFGGGGRYNNLLEELGGVRGGCVGFALGMERMLMIIDNLPSLEEGIFIFIAVTDKLFYNNAISLLYDLREKGFEVDLDYRFGSLKSQMRRANKLKARFCIIIGKDEVEKNFFTLRDMENAQQMTLGYQDLLAYLSKQKNA